VLIRDVQVLNLHYDLPDKGFVCAEGRTNARLTSLVEVTTDEGLTGWGSAYSHPDVLRMIVEQHLRPYLVGEQCSDIDALWRKMYTLTQWYGRKGVAISALGAIDIALWDIRGKELGKPLYQLLGGTDPWVNAYASGLLWQDDLAVLQAEAQKHMADGFTTMKMRLGRDPEYDRAAVLALREVLADKGRIAVDGTHRYTLEGASQFSHFLASQDVAWFEEPFPPEDVETYSQLREQGIVPVAAGENEFGIQGFRELFRIGAVDVAQPDASRTGGVSEVFKIGQLAASCGIDVVTHTWNDAVALVANAHVVAALTNGMMIELDRTGNPFIDDLTVAPLDILDGRLRLSDAPGLGIDLRPEALARYLVPPDQTVQDGNYADLVFGKDFQP
jgi:D-galactarolactone cycloisomerase